MFLPIVLFESLAKNIRTIALRIIGAKHNNIDISNSNMLEVYPKFASFSFVLNFLRKEAFTRFTSATDVTGVDYPSRTLKDRFQVNYFLLSYDGSSRSRVIENTNGRFPLVSQTSSFPSVNWLEREVWDMFGVSFIKHPDLRRF